MSFLFLRKAFAPPRIFQDRYIVEDNSRVTLYTDDAKLFPRHRLRQSPRGARQTRVQASLIASARDEADNAERWFRSILNQTRLPDEIIVVDAGSSDGTAQALQRLAGESRVSFTLLVEPGANIARARNRAIARARFAVIAVTDFGCQPRADWLEKIIAPFELQPETLVAAGMYEPVTRSGEPTQQRGRWLTLERIDPQTFLPSSRSLAFKKEAWQAVGGYPEWLTLTGEDTYFDLELKRHGGEWAFVPGAVIAWNAPETLLDYWHKLYQWSVGDGESGIHARHYWRYVLQFCVVFIALLILAMLALLAPLQPPALWQGVFAALALLGLFAAMRDLRLNVFAHAAMVLGFLQGARRQDEITRRRLCTVRGTFFILSGVPIDDTGGGARCTQIALELLRERFAVVFVSRFPKYESRDLNLRILHPNLFVRTLDEFVWDAFAQQYSPLFDGKPLAALVEFPLDDFVPVIRSLRARGGVVVYDLIDAWDTTLGSGWYSKAVEKEIVQSSQVLVATVPVLAERLGEMSGRRVALLPNAVNARLFNPARSHPRPADLPRARWTAIYVGALWGEWFDWDLLARLAHTHREAAIVVIGDYRGQCPNAPVNLHFLGLKPQSALPAYLAYADVAIIPWEISAITQATSPLKMYEYLAMHLPVVAPDLEHLRGIPGVLLARDADEFVACVGQAREMEFPLPRVNRFVAENNWQARVNQLVQSVDEARGRTE
jgi:GT2 family glycosyltransferase